MRFRAAVDDHEGLRRRRKTLCAQRDNAIGPFEAQSDRLLNCPNPTLRFRFVHKPPQFGLRCDQESSKSFQEPQANWMPFRELVPSRARSAFAGGIYISASLKIAVYDTCVRRAFSLS